jgi:hypothetical protein
MQRYQNSIIDNRGLPLIGGSVTVYILNGPAATIYSDNGVTITANPLTTDENGYFEFYAANGRYSLTINGENIQTTVINDVYLADDPVTPESLASSVGSSLVGFIQYGTGATRQTVETKLRERVSAEDFFLASDSDQTGMIQRAIDAIANVGGGDVELTGNATYIVTGLTIKSKVRLIGRGRYKTIIRLKDGTNTDVIKTEDADTLWPGTTTGGAYGWTIEGLQIDGNRASNTSGSGLKIYGYNFNLSDLLIKHCADSGIESKWTVGSPSFPDILMEAYVERVTVLECGEHGVYWAGPHDTHFNTVILVQNSQKTPNTYHGLFVDSGTGFTGASTFTYLHVWGVFHKYAAYVNADPCIFSNSHIEGADVNLYINKNNCMASGCAVYGVGSAPDGAGDVGIYFNAVSGCHIDAKVMNCAGGLIQAAGACSYNKIDVSGFNTTGPAVVGTLSSTNDLNIQIFGSADDDTFQIGRTFASGPLIRGTVSGIGFCNDTLYVKDNFVGVGTTSPDQKFHVAADGNLFSKVESGGGIALFSGFRSGGTLASKTIISNGDEVTRYDGRGYDGSTYRQMGYISVRSAGVPAAGNTPGKLVFGTNIGSTTAGDRLELTSDGNLIPCTNNASSLGNTSFAYSVVFSYGLRVKEGINAKQGTATLVAGTVTIANTSVTANSRILLTSQVDGGTPGFLRVSARVVGTSFTITSSNAADTSTVAYQIFEPA